MAEILRAIRNKTAEENPILGDKVARDLRRKLAQGGERLPLPKILVLRRRLGRHELHLGHTRTGIAGYRFVSETLENAFANGAPVPGPDRAKAAFNLGVALLHLGIEENSGKGASPGASILPITGAAVHRRRSETEAAAKLFGHILDLAPEKSRLSLKARWLLALTHMLLGDDPDEIAVARRLPEAAFGGRHTGFPRFPNRAPALSLDRVDLAGGAVVDDFNQDGFLDVAVSTSDTAKPMALYLNAGDGTFAKHAAHLDEELGGFNLAAADYDNDGDLDLYVLRGAWLGSLGRHPNSLLRNDGTGRFVDVTFDAGMGAVSFPTQAAAFADYDGDGDLDLYVASETRGEMTTPSQLFENQGNGTFVDRAAEASVSNDRYAKSVAWGDYDGDDHPDLFVSNLNEPNRLYRSNGDGTFTDVAPALHVEGPSASFVSWFFDYDNDGVQDLFVAGYDWSKGNLSAVVASALGLDAQFARNHLYRGDGNHGFTDVASSVGLATILLPMACNVGDLDNDGYLDFYMGTGYPDYEALMPNVMYRNVEGKRFEDVTMSGGFGHLQKGHGIAFADIDNDGDQDIFEQMGGFFPGDAWANALYENPGFGHHFVALDLEGRTSNRDAVGVRIRIDIEEEGKNRSIYKTVGPGASFGVNPRRQEIGIGAAKRIRLLSIHWPATGKTQRFEDVPIDRFLVIKEDDANYRVAKRPRITLRQ